jgi:hypothetical protein
MRVALATPQVIDGFVQLPLTGSFGAGDPFEIAARPHHE